MINDIVNLQVQTLSNVNWLIPQPEIIPNESNLINNIEKYQFADIVYELIETNLVKSQRPLDDFTQLSALTDPNLKGLVFAGIGNMHSFYGDYSKAFSSFHRAIKYFNKDSPDEALAFLYFSMNNLMRKLGNKNVAEMLSNQALSLTKNENLRRRIYVHKAQLKKYGPLWREAIKEFEAAIEYYAKTENYFRLARVQLHLAHVYIFQKQYLKSYELLANTEKIALEENRRDFVVEIRSDRGYLMFLQGRLKEAWTLLKSLSINPSFPFQNALVLQNMGLIAREEKRYYEAISCFKNSLAITEPNDMRDLLLEDYRYLAKLYQSVAETKRSAEYFEKSYNCVLEDLKTGLPLDATRQKAMAETLEYFKTHSGVNTRNSHIFNDLKEKSLSANRYLFQQTLLAIHLGRISKLLDLSTQLEITTRTLHGLRKKLGLMNNRNWDTILKDSPIANYVDGFLNYNWKEANARFENEFIQYALKQNGYNKRKTAQQLDISYPQILMKTGANQKDGIVT